MKALTKRQEQTLRVVMGLIERRETDVLRVAARELGLKGGWSVAVHLRALEREGYIEYRGHLGHDGHNARGRVRVLRDPEGRRVELRYFVVEEEASP